jgi:uncharacterized protein YjdB
MRLRYLLSLAVLLSVGAGLTAVSGCGGGQSGASLTQTASTGRAVVAVNWPSRSRLIPAASNSIRIEVLRGANIIASQLIARPDTGESVVTFEHLPVVPLTVRAHAFPGADGSGVAQAAGSAPVTVIAGQTVNFDITMATTVDQIAVTPNDVLLRPGVSATLTVTAKDAAGNIVLIAPEKLQWTIADPTIATLSQTGIVTGSRAGKTQVTVTETESGESAAMTVTVGARTTL